MNLVAGAVLALMLFQQVPRPGQRGRIQQGGVAQNANTDAVATFDGVFKSADKKYLLIETDEGNSMRMAVTGATKFVRDGKPAKASDFKPDEKVTVDTSRDAKFNLIAVKVETAPAAKPAPGAAESNK
jgi:hypothetical protein